MEKSMSSVIVMFCAVFLISCNEENIKEQIPIANKICYKINDTLFFQNAKQDLDTFCITKISLKKDETGFYVGKNHVYSFDILYNQLPNRELFIRETIIRGNKKIYNKLDPSLIKVFYSTTTRDFSFYFSFKDFQCSFLNKHLDSSKLIMLDIGKDTIGVYKLYGGNEQKSNSVNCIYWNACLGIVAYEYENGEYWKLTRQSSSYKREIEAESR